MERKINLDDFYYPSAINWMWDYCIPLGKFTDSKGNNYDLGIHIVEDVFNGKPYREVSAAIVNGNESGDYYSGNLKENRKSDDPGFNWYHEKYNETHKRAKERGLL